MITGENEKNHRSTDHAKRTNHKSIHTISHTRSYHRWKGQKKGQKKPAASLKPLRMPTPNSAELILSAIIPTKQALIMCKPVGSSRRVGNMFLGVTYTPSERHSRFLYDLYVKRRKPVVPFSRGVQQLYFTTNVKFSAKSTTSINF